MSYHFRDPIHGMIDISNTEEKIIKSEPFQRLRYIRQLGTTYLVYHGAEHTRFGHSIGVMHLISRAIDCLSRKEPLKEYIKNHPDDFNRLRQTARLSALLHDIGHAPFSHVGENKEFGLFPQMEDVDGVIRSGHETYSHLIIKNIIGPEIESNFSDINTADILSLLLGTPYDAQQHFLCDLLDGQLDVDKMDYLLRDSHYCGVKYGTYDLDRMLDVICICPTDYNEWQLGIDSNGVHAAEEFIFARYWMFLQVYFHKTRRIYDYYLSHFLKAIHSPYPTELTEYLKKTDAIVLENIRNLSKSNKWAKHLFERNHMQEVYISPPHHEKDEDLEFIARLIDNFGIDYSEQIASHRCYIDQADTSSVKSLIEIKEFKSETDPESESNNNEAKRKLPAIPVKDKHSDSIFPIQHYSLPIRKMSDLKINLFRIYADNDLNTQIKDYIIAKEIEVKEIIAKEKSEWVQTQKQIEEHEKQVQEHALEAEKLRKVMKENEVSRKDILNKYRK